MLIVPEFCNKLKIEKIRETYKYAIFMCVCVHITFPISMDFNASEIICRLKNLMISHI